MSTTTRQGNATYRTVVLLRPDEKKRLQKLAGEANVSSSEIIRRSLHAYLKQESDLTTDEDQQMRLALAEMNKSLDGALASVRSARLEVAQNIAEIRRLRSSREKHL